MGKKVSITVHPSSLSAEYLTVSDAMKQVLDLIGALENIEAGDDSERKIVWRLTNAHTNSPPFTVEADPFPKDPQVSVAIEAERVTRLYAMAGKELLTGTKPVWLADEAAQCLRRALKRNTNGVGYTDVRISDVPAFSIVPKSAHQGLAALERAKLEDTEDMRRTEFGSVEGRVVGLTKYYSSPALVFQERLSNERVVCVLTPELAGHLGPENKWSDAWEGRYLLVSGELFYGVDGKLKRINAIYSEKVAVPEEISLKELQKVDVLQGRTIQEHIDEFWGERFG